MRYLQAFLISLVVTVLAARICIPLLRRLFGSTDASAQRSEILILITGTVVTEKNQVEDMIRKYNDALRYLNAFDRTLGDQPDAGKPFTVFEEGDVSR